MNQTRRYLGPTQTSPTKNRNEEVQLIRNTIKEEYYSLDDRFYMPLEDLIYMYDHPDWDNTPLKYYEWAQEEPAEYDAYVNNFLNVKF